MPGTGRVAGLTPHTVVGRDGEMTRLADLARNAAAGRGKLILIEGEPGIGKTLLLRTFLADAAGLFPHTVTGAAEEFDQRLPFATVHSWLAPLAAGDRRVAEVLALIRGGSAEYPVIESVMALVEQWCAESARWRWPSTTCTGRIRRRFCCCTGWRG